MENVRFFDWCLGCIMALACIYKERIALKKCIYIWCTHCFIRNLFGTQKKNALSSTIYIILLNLCHRTLCNIVKAAKNIFAEFDIAVYKIYKVYTQFWLCIYTTILIRYFDLQLHERIWGG